MKRTLFRAIAVIAAAEVLLVSCTRIDQASPDGPATVEVKLTATIDGNYGPLTASAAAQSGIATSFRAVGDPTTKAPVLGTSFPQGTYDISLVVLKDDKKTPWDTGYGNIKATVRVGKDGMQTWSYTINGTVYQTLAFTAGIAANMWITAIYPYSTTAPTIATDGSGKITRAFDLTTEQANQSDIMICAAQDLSMASTDRSKVLMLNFKHFYTMFEFNIAPIFSSPAQITKIVFSNGTARNWVANKGTVSSLLAMTSPTYGEVTTTSNATMEMGRYTTYRVMIPPSTLTASTFIDGDISVQFTDGLNTVVQPRSFKILKEWVTAAGGIQSGDRFAFHILYDNDFTGKGSMTVTNWALNGEIIDGLGIGSPAEGYLYWESGALVKSGTISGATHTIANSQTTSYNGYTYDAVTNNGGYYGSLGVILNELPYHQLEVAKTYETGTYLWKAGWDACKAKTTDGGGWRLPRASEAMLMWFNKDLLATVAGFEAFQENFLTGTEINAASVWELNPSASSIGTLDKTSDQRAVRCVRELPVKVLP